MPDQKVALVTAAGKGIGAGIARALSEGGYRLALMSNSGGAETLARELDAFGMTGSVTSLDDLAALVRDTMGRFGRIDAVVSNTGHAPKGPLLEITDDDWHAGLDLLLLNVVRIARLVTPIMQKQGGGAFVNVSTFATYEPELVFPVSGSLRAALGSFTKLFSDRYGPENIRMNNVLPGYVDSWPVTQENVDRIPLGRYATAAEIGQVVRFLASDEGAYITGQNIRVDGGITRAV